MKQLEKAKYFKTIQFTNCRRFKNRLNRDMSVKIHRSEYEDPLTIIPKSLYNDLDRKNYKRH